MKYYVVTDTHGFYTLLREALEKAGFFCETEPHKLVLCGDMMDRGAEALQMQDFMLQLWREDKLIYIRGNHEDLLEAMLYDISCARPVSGIHEINGTWDTAVQLSGLDPAIAVRYPGEVASRVRQTPFYKTLLPAAIDYFETSRYVFVHGWLPGYEATQEVPPLNGELHCRPDWREAGSAQWRQARWYNGMECASVFDYGVPGKTTVCGHWHASFGHANFEQKGSEYGDDADFSPFYGKGIIALDSCAAHSGFVNCIVLED